MASLLRLIGALHARGFHPAVLAGLIMMPAVIAVGFWSDHALRVDAGAGPGLAIGDLRGSLDDPPPLRGTPRPGF